MSIQSLAISSFERCQRVVRPRIRLWPTALLWLVALLTACGGTSTESRESAELVAARARWSAARPAGDRYVMLQQVACFCPTGANTYRVTVTGDVITAVALEATNAPLDPQMWSMFRTVSQLFAAVQEAERKRGTLRAVEFDATLGFPRVVSLDPLPDAVDDEVSYVTRSVTPSP